MWFVGGQPHDLTPDKAIQHFQVGATKWEKAKSSFMEIIKCDEISDNFFLFNDDFFVMRPPEEEFINFVGGTLEKRVTDMERGKRIISTYTRSLDKLRSILYLKHYDTMSFALHVPMLINKKLMAKTLEEFPNTSMFRSAYGNSNKIPYKYHEDVKIYDNGSLPKAEWEFVSTTEESFAHGQVGRYLREKFREPSRFEESSRVINVKELYTEEGDLLMEE